MRVGWLADETDTPGGAELTQAEFANSAPEGIEIVACPPGKVRKDCDRYVIQNCVKYPVKDLARTEGKPIVKYWHDVGPWVQAGVKDWIAEHATQITCSPLQADYMGIDAVSIPPPVDLARFGIAAAAMNGGRAGNVCIGSWRNYGKAAHRVAEWAAQHGPVEFFGAGPFAPPGAREVAYEHMPALLASYERFVFLPAVIEPFGRLVAEAWAAGCEIVTNDLVGAKWWITERPEGLETAATDFWWVVLA